MDSHKLLELLKKSTRETIGSEKTVAVAYSGGVDSSVIAKLAGDISGVICYSCMTSSSYDARNIGALAAKEELSLEAVMIDDKDIARMVSQASNVLGSEDPVRIAYTIPVMRVIEICEQRLILVGSGADELFAGYAKYSSLKDPREMMKNDFNKMIEEKEHLEMMAKTAGKRLGYPFVCEEIVSFSRNLPLSDMIGSSGRKLILRDAARILGLESHARPKKAAQYSSGVMKEMGRMAKASGLDLRTWIRKMVSEESERSH